MQLDISMCAAKMAKRQCHEQRWKTRRILFLTTPYWNTEISFLNSCQNVVTWTSPIPECVGKSMKWRHSENTQIDSNYWPPCSCICRYSDSFDGDFIITPHPKHKNLIVASGDSGHGMKYV